MLTDRQKKRCYQLQPDGTLKGIVAYADVANVNGTIFPRSELEKLAVSMRANRRGFVYVVPLSWYLRPTLMMMGGVILDAVVEEDGALVVVVEVLRSASGSVLLACTNCAFALAATGARHPETGLVSEAVFDYLHLVKVEDVEP